MSDLLDPFAKNLQKQIQGSAFINNTSYSGCDIKVVINLYGSDSSEKKNRDLDIEIDNLISEMKKVESAISFAQSNLNIVNPGTSESLIFQNELSGLTDKKRRISDMLQSADLKRVTISKEHAEKTTKVLAEVQTISTSIFRDKQAVRACGSVYPLGFTRGPREIAGSLVFTVFDEHVLYQFLEAHPSDFDANRFTSALMDQLPPVDITISFANEYGQISRMAIYGVEFINEGQTMSIEDILTENVVSFVARDIDPMRSVSQRKIDEHSNRLQVEMAKRASDLILEEDYQFQKNKIDPYTRFKRRRNPFI